MSVTERQRADFQDKSGSYEINKEECMYMGYGSNWMTTIGRKQSFRVNFFEI